MAVRKFVISALFTGLAAVTLVGCGDEEKPKEAVQVYSDVDQCKAEHSEQDCVQAFEGAQSDHETSAPHMTLGQCVDSYGASACLPRHDSSGDFFVPAMAGFALGMMANSHSVYQPVYVDLSGRAYYHSSPIGTYHPGCYGCGGTTVVHVYPQARSWSQSYERKPLAPEQRTAKPSPPAYTYGQPSQTERGGFSRPGNMASPAAKTIQTPSPSAYSPTPSQSPSPSPSTTQRGGFGSPGASAAPAAKTYQSTPSTPSTSSFHSAPSPSPSRGGFSRGK